MSKIGNKEIRFIVATVLCIWFVLPLNASKKMPERSAEKKLLSAMRTGSLCACLKALQSGADPKKTVEEAGIQISLLPLAASVGLTDISKLLVFFGAYLETQSLCGYRALHFAAERGDYELCDFLLRRGAVVDALIPEDTGSTSGFTPLFFAIGAGSLELCKLFIEQKADVNHVATVWCWKKTPLAYAAEKGFLDICKLLIARGAKTQEDFFWGSPEINNYVIMAHRLRQVHAEKMSIETFVNYYLGFKVQRENVFDVVHTILALWGLDTPIFSKIWAYCTEPTKNYFFLTTDFKFLSEDKMSVQEYVNKHLNEKNFKKNSTVIRELIEKSDNPKIVKKFACVLQAIDF